MSLARFKGQNHPQQIAKRGALVDVDDRGTTAELFDPLNERFRFSIDVAAAAHNAKCPRFFTIDDGLAQSWASERVWCNPPYSNLGPWVAKAWHEWRSDRPPHVIVMLVPANRTEQAWWQDHVEPFRDRPGPCWPCRRGGPLTVEFLRGRQRFILPGHTEVLPNQRPPFGVALLIWQDPDLERLDEVDR